MKYLTADELLKQMYGEKEKYSYYETVSAMLAFGNQTIDRFSSMLKEADQKCLEILHDYDNEATGD